MADKDGIAFVGIERSAVGFNHQVERGKVCRFPEQAVCQTEFSGALQCPLRHLLSFVISK